MFSDGKVLGIVDAIAAKCHVDVYDAIDSNPYNVATWHDAIVAKYDVGGVDAIAAKVRNDEGTLHFQLL